MSGSKSDRVKIVTILFLVFVLAFFHFMTGIEQSPYYGFYCRLYYLPIVLAGLWFCLRGGIIVSILVTILFAPHLFFQWGGANSIPFEHYLEMFFFVFTGIVSIPRQSRGL